MLGEISEGTFIILRSANGQHYEPLDMISVTSAPNGDFNSIDKHPLKGDNYYMIQFTNQTNGSTINSKAVKVVSSPTGGFNLYPVPFNNKFFISYNKTLSPEKILLTDASGRNVRTRHIMRPASQIIEVVVLDNIQPGIYILHMRTDKTVIAKTIFKQ
jgi:hypothetical protein